MHDRPIDRSTWDDVRIFLALCRSRTVGEAARALGVDASTVSRRLVALEESLDASLFDRGRSGLAPTSAALDLLPVAESVEETMRRFTLAAEGLERRVAGIVRIACPPDVAEVVLAPLLAELVRTYPELRFDVEPSERIVDLARREADIALRVVRPRHGDLLVTKLLSARWVIAASPERATELGVVSDLASLPWLGWGPSFAELPAARWLLRHARGVEPIARSDRLTVQIAMVRAGVGVALVPRPSLAHYALAAVTLSRALRSAEAELPSNELYLVTHRALRDVPRVRVVWDLIANRLGPRPARTVRPPRGGRAVDER